MEVSVAEFRRHTKRVLAAVDRNETVTITYRGKPRAIVRPIRKRLTLDEMKRHPSFGMWKDREDMKDPTAWVRKQRKSRIRDL